MLQTKVVSRPSAPERRLLGIALRCMAATAFALMGALLKHASMNGASVPELMFFRSVGALPIVAGWVLLTGGRAGIAVNDWSAHLTRSGIGFAGMVLTFGTLALLPLPQATTLSYSAPVGATLLSALLLGEAVGPHRWLAVLIGFAGVVLVADPLGRSLPPLGLLVGLGAALAQASVMITLRQITGRERTSAIVFWFTVFTSLASALLLPWGWRGHPPAMLALLGLAGLCGGIAQLAMTASLAHAPVSVVVPFDYLQILWATLIGWLFFANPIPATMLAGAALIAGSGIYTAWRESRRGPVGEALTIPEP